jgi:hypothetical protein
MEITWKIEQLDRQSLNGFVTSVHWKAIAVDGNYTAVVYGSCGWPFDNSISSIVPYEQLTPKMVLSWIWADGVNKNEIESNLLTQINLQKNPVIKIGTPWQ